MQTGADCAFSTIFRAAWNMARLSPIGATIALTITHNFKLRYTVKTGLPGGLGPRAAVDRPFRHARPANVIPDLFRDPASFFSHDKLDPGTGPG